VLTFGVDAAPCETVPLTFNVNKRDSFSLTHPLTHSRHTPGSLANIKCQRSETASLTFNVNKPGCIGVALTFNVDLAPCETVPLTFNVHKRDSFVDM